MKFIYDGTDGPCKQLVLVLHGYSLALTKYDPVRKAIKQQFPDARLVLPVMPLGRFSTANANIVASDILEGLDAEWNRILDAQSERPSVIIVGHSTGAMLAKKVYACACGENADAPFEQEIQVRTERDWAKDVERLVLLAGMGRGWSANHHLRTYTALLVRAGALLGFFYRLLGITPVAFQTKRGAPFVTQLRLQWLSMLQANKGKTGKAMVVQLLGTIDDLVPPDDNVDLVTGASFIYLDVPNSGHLDVLDMDDPKAGPARKAVFLHALTNSQEQLTQDQATPSDTTAVVVDTSVTDVVFVVHGIRDTGYWTQKVARRVKILGKRKNRKFATETSTYGYFAMLPFLFYRQRRAKVEWFMEQYTENRAAYPNAEFSFIGHSNGTYLLAKALAEYPACRFKHVAFAGSVVAFKYDWTSVLNSKRIEKVYNIVADSDWVVAMFPRAFQQLRLQDIGSGGYDGFKHVSPAYQHKFVRGGHGAAVKEKYWDEIASFIVDGVPNSHLPDTVKNRSIFMKLLGATAPLPFFVAVGVVVTIPVLVFYFSNTPKVEYGFAAGYGLAVWRLLTRF